MNNNKKILRQGLPEDFFVFRISYSVLQNSFR